MLSVPGIQVQDLWKSGHPWEDLNHRSEPQSLEYQRSGVIFNGYIVALSVPDGQGRDGCENRIYFFAFFFTVTMATHSPSILSNSQNNSSPSLRPKWSRKPAGTVVLKLLVWFAFDNLLLKPDIVLSYYCNLFKYLFNYLYHYLYKGRGNIIGNGGLYE